MDERDLSHTVQGPTFLSLNAWRQVSETWLQKRSPGRNLGKHRLVRRSGTTSRGTALILLYLCKCLFWVVFFEQVQASLNYFIRPFRKIENRHFLKSSHFAIIWSFGVTNLGSNALQKRKMVYFRNNFNVPEI